MVSPSGSINNFIQFLLRHAAGAGIRLHRSKDFIKRLCVAIF